MNQNQIKKTYDKEAREWKDLILSGKAFLYKNRYFLKLAHDSKKRRLLDVGCGNGIQSIELAKQGFRVTGIDFSAGMIKEAKRNGAHTKSVSFVCGDFNTHRFKEKFSVIWANCSFHNMDLPTLKKALQTSYSLLEIGGILAIKMRRGTSRV